MSESDGPSRSAFPIAAAEWKQTPASVLVKTLRSRGANVAIALGYFLTLCLGPNVVGLSGLFAAYLIFLFLAIPRLKHMGLERLAGFYVFIAFSMATYDGLRSAPLLLQFCAILPLVLFATLPADFRLTGEGESNISRGPVGRIGFILVALPSFVLLGAFHWDGLAQLLVQGWNLIMPREESVPKIAVLAATVWPAAFADRRARDAGLRNSLAKTIFVILTLTVVLEIAARQLIAALSPAVPAVDLLLAAEFLALCLWPARQAEARV